MNAQPLDNRGGSTSQKRSGAIRRALPAILFGLLPALAATAARDPFWPIGYEPPKPEPVAAVAAPTPAAPEKSVARPKEPPVNRPISEDDWAAARKSLIVSGYTQSVRPGTGETRIQVMINRRTYAPGDTLSITNLSTHFVWRIESLANRELKLQQIEAARINVSNSPTLKQ